MLPASLHMHTRGPGEHEDLKIAFKKKIFCWLSSETTASLYTSNDVYIETRYGCASSRLTGLELQLRLTERRCGSVHQLHEDTTSSDFGFRFGITSSRDPDAKK